MAFGSASQRSIQLSYGCSGLSKFDTNSKYNRDRAINQLQTEQVDDTIDEVEVQFFHR